jgi:hypothetical protein
VHCVVHTGHSNPVTHGININDVACFAFILFSSVVQVCVRADACSRASRPSRQCCSTGLVRPYIASCMTSQHSFGRWPRELYWRWESRWPPPSRRDSSLRLRHRLAAAAASSSGGEVLLVLSTHTHDKQRRLVGHRGRRLAGAAAGRRGRCSRRSHAHRCLSCHRLHRRLRVRRAARPANGRARERKRDGGGLSPAKPKDRMNQHRWPVCTRGCASQVAASPCVRGAVLGANLNENGRR